MKNILNQRPSDTLNGRLLESANFVDQADVTDRTILDIGCGYGWFELNFLSRGARKITGIEITEEDLKTAKANVTDDRVSFALGSAIELPFENESFDTVVSWEVIEHIPKNTEHQMLAEISRVLRPNGTCYISTPNHALLCKVSDPAWWLIGHRHYSSQFLEKLGKAQNLQLEEVRIRGGLWVLTGVLNMYVAKWIFRRRPFFEKFFQGKETEEYRTDGFETLFVKFRKIAHS